MAQVDQHSVPKAGAPTGMGEPGLPALAAAFANTVAKAPAAYGDAIRFQRPMQKR